MDFANLKAGNGFINQQDVFNRLADFRYPDASLILRRCEDFSIVSVIIDNEAYPLFRVYTGNRNLYLYIRDMVREVANQLESDFEADEWKKNETWTSEEVLAALEERTRRE